MIYRFQCAKGGPLLRKEPPRIAVQLTSLATTPQITGSPAGTPTVAAGHPAHGPLPLSEHIAAWITNPCSPRDLAGQVRELTAATPDPVLRPRRLPCVGTSSISEAPRELLPPAQQAADDESDYL